MIKLLINKKNDIYIFLGLSIALLFFTRSLFSIPIFNFNQKDIIFALLTTILIFVFIFEILHRLFKTKILNNFLFYNILYILLILIFASLSTYGKFNFSSVYGLSNLFNDKKYENKTISLIKSDKNYNSTKVPTNVSNIILTTKSSDKTEEIGFNIFICYSKTCTYIYQNIYIGIEEYSYIIRVPNGYNVEKITIDNIGKPKNYFSEIEYNDTKIHSSMYGLNLKKIFLYGVLVLILIDFLYFIFSNKIKLFLENIKKKCKIKIQHVFVILGLFLGIIFSFLIPPFNVPDEPVHIKMIFESIGIENVYENIMNDYSCDSCAKSMISSVKKVDFNEFLGISNIKLDNYSINNISFSVKSFRHLPQILGLLIGYLFKLPIFWMLSLGEIFVTIFYVIGGYFVLKIIPLKKDIMFFIMLLPMAIQQYSSFSYDMSLNICCFLFFSLILKYKFTSAKIDFKSIITFMFLLIIIAICKLPYIMLVLLFLMIPLEKYNIGIFHKLIDVEKILKNKIIVLVFMLFVILFLVLIFPKLAEGRLIIATLLELPNFIKLLTNTLIINMRFYLVSLIANFGWLNTPVSMKYVLFVLVFCIFKIIFKKNNVNENEFSIKDKIILFLIFASILIFIHIVMITWTFMDMGLVINDSIKGYREGIKMIGSNIVGVQGRYFIPLLPLLFFIPKRVKIKLRDDNYDLINYTFYIISFAYCIYILLFRFWL